MIEEPQEKIEEIVNEIFTKGSFTALIAGDILTKYRETKEELSEEYREQLIEKYMQAKDTPQKSRRRIANVLARLRKAGRYEDAYSRGEKPAVGVTKTALEKQSSNKPPTDPAKPPLISPFKDPSKPPIQEVVEDDTRREPPSKPETLKIEVPPVNKPKVEKAADELGVDPRELQAFLEAKAKEKVKSEEARLLDLVDQRLKQLLNAPLPNNPGTSNSPPISDAEKLRTTMEGASPAELRLLLKKKAGGVENPMLATFQLMESEASVVDIMDEMQLDFEQIIEYQEKFNKMKELELERQQLTEPYLKAWFDLAVTLGEDMRRNCSNYNEVSGVCEYWRLDELSETYRKTYAGLYKSAGKKKGGYYINVDKHAEACAICSFGMIKKEGGI